jgi:peptidoglycan/xylan/chitin deacetylase (PgdA/CDA1 family)
MALVFMLAAPTAASSVLTHGPRDRAWVALTFDDGWAPERCEQIARTLRAKRATATFFINGANLNRAPAYWRGILEGFPVANHTLTHPWLDRLGETAIRDQIQDNERVTERILGRPMLRLLRPPYGAYDSRVVSIADSLGYRTLLWDVDSGDTSRSPSVGTVISNATRGGKGSIVLMHCGPAVTPPAVGQIVDSYRSRGFQLVDLATMLGTTPPPRACRVHNVTSGRTSDSLQQAVSTARAGTTLTLRGICRGVTAIGRDLFIKGIRTRTSGTPC